MKTQMQKKTLAEAEQVLKSAFLSGDDVFIVTPDGSEKQVFGGELYYVEDFDLDGDITMKFLEDGESITKEIAVSAIRIGEDEPFKVVHTAEKRLN